MKKIIFLNFAFIILFVLASGCTGYKPIYATSNFNFKIEEHFIKGDIELVKYFIKFFKLKKINLINDDILNIKKYSKKFKKISLIYIDCDIYETTKIILENLSSKLSKGGIIVFDEGNQKNFSGETKAMREFYEKNKKYYKRILLKRGYQPDIYLEKVK